MERQLRILLVEDDTSYAVSIERALKQHYFIDHQTTEAEAFRMLYVESYDVLLLDLTLNSGYLSGYRFLDYLKRLERFKDLIIISLSGMTTEVIEANPSFNKLSASLTKPVTPEEIMATIERCITKASAISSPKEISNTSMSAP